MSNDQSHLKTSGQSTLRLIGVNRLQAWLLTILGLVPIEAAVAAESGALSGRSQGSVSIRVSVSPRVWTTSAGIVCSNLPLNSYGLRSSNDYKPLATVNASSGTCHNNKPSINALKEVEGSSLVIVVPE